MLFSLPVLHCNLGGLYFFHWFLQVHMSFPNVDQFINLLVSVPADGHENSFAYVMTEWTKQQGKHLSLLRYLVVWFYLSTWCVGFSGRLNLCFVKHLCSGEIQGAYQIKVTCSALALLLSTRHSEFAKVNVPGNRIQVFLCCCTFLYIYF